MCTYCQYAKLCGDTIYCTVNYREPTSKEYNECSNYKLDEVIQREYDLEQNKGSDIN